jgi:uncharacterized protein YdhG (YjbR/CyaY superfamily)
VPAPAPDSIDAYLAAFSSEARRLLEELRTVVHATAPGVTERISYGIPRFDLNGKYVIYIAGWKKHVGLYPITGDVAAALAAEIAPFTTGKPTLRFPLGQALPTELIRRIVALRVEEISGR